MKILFLLFTFSALNIGAQVFHPKGEVDIKKVQYLFSNPRWLEGNLSKGMLNRKSELLKVEDLYAWADYSPTGSAGMKKTFFETSADGIPLYLFSHLAISEGKVCPIGYRLPKWSDVLNSYANGKIRFGVRKNMESIFPVRTLNVNQSKSIETWDEFSYNEVPNENAIFWLDSMRTESYFDENKQKQIEFDIAYRTEISSDGEPEIWGTELGTGLPVRCIQNGLGQLKEKTFLYHSLLPNNFRSLIESITERMVVNPIAKNTQAYSFNMKFDNNGANISNAFSYAPEDNDFLFSLNQQVQNFNIFPYVDKTPIKISSQVKIESNEINSIPFDKNSIREVIGNNLAPEVQIKYGLSSNKEFEVIGEKLDYKIKVSEESKGVTILDYDIKVSKIREVRANGPLQAFKSVVPGLGLGGVLKHTAKVGNKYRRRKLLKNILFIGAITAGVTAITTKFVSDDYYSRYLNDLYGENANSNYRIANNNNKVFITSVSLYAILGAIDVGFTIPIGLSQKVKQKRINKKIKTDSGIVFRRF